MQPDPPLNDLGSAARRGVSWSLVSVAGSSLAGVLQLGIAARFLSRDDFGLMALILIVVGFSQNFSDLGTANAVLYRQRATRAELDSLFWLSVAVGVALFALVAASGPLFARLWSEPALATWLPLAAGVFPFIGAMQVPTALLQRELRFRELALVEIAGALASLLAVGVLSMRGFGVVSLLVGQLAAGSVRWVAATAACWPIFRPHLHFDPHEVRPYLAFGSYQLGERMMNFAWRNLDKIVIGTWLGADALGVYTLAYQLVIRPFQFLTSITSRVMRSVLARMQDDRNRLVRGYLASVRLIAFIAFPAYLGAFTVADPLVRLVYGPGWSDVAALFAIIWPLGALYAIGNPIGALVVATGKARAAFAWNIFVALIQLAAVIAGVRFGVRGVAIAVVVANACVLFPCSFYLIWILVRLRPGPFLACLGRPLAYALVMGAAVHGLATLLAGLDAPWKLATAIGSGVAIYGALIWTRERALLISLRGSQT